MDNTINYTTGNGNKKGFYLNIESTNTIEEQKTCTIELNSDPDFFVNIYSGSGTNLDEEDFEQLPSTTYQINSIYNKEGAVYSAVNNM